MVPLLQKLEQKLMLVSDTINEWFILIETKLKTMFFISSLEYNSSIMVFIPVYLTVILTTLLYNCSNFPGLS